MSLERVLAASDRCAWCAAVCSGNEPGASADVAYGGAAVCCLDPEGGGDDVEGNAMRV